ncbi:hypothetical protein MRBLWO14_000968 [Microbacterium sp. LWO14-1.2]|uniref:hypothetical protein n=1 Tax=Microbacterium sp. LWO14-1.2 TaxID=3135263 RepID=UPI00313A1D45
MSDQMSAVEHAIWEVLEPRLEDVIDLDLNDVDDSRTFRELVRQIASAASVVTEEPEWEYGVESRFEESDEAYDAVEWMSREQAEEVARDQNEEEAHEDGYVRLVHRVVKRIPAVPPGPWLPVEQGDET